MRITNAVAPNYYDCSDGEKSDNKESGSYSVSDVSVDKDRKIPSLTCQLKPVRKSGCPAKVNKIIKRCSSVFCQEGPSFSVGVKHFVLASSSLIFIACLCFNEYQEISTDRDKFKATSLSFETAFTAEVIKRGVLETQIKAILFEKDELTNETLSMKKKLEYEIVAKSALSNQLQEAVIGRKELKDEVAFLQKTIEALSIKKAELAAEKQAVSMEIDELKVKLLFLETAMQSQ